MAILSLFKVVLRVIQFTDKNSLGLKPQTLKFNQDGKYMEDWEKLLVLINFMGLYSNKEKNIGVGGLWNLQA